MAEATPVSGCERVMLFIESGGPGGAESVVLRLAAALRERGFDTSVMTTRTGWLTETLRDRGIPHVKVEAGGRLDPGFPRRIAAVLRERRIDVLHTHLLDSNVYGGIAARLAGVRHVATEHGDVHHTRAKKLLRTKVRLMSLLGARMTAVSQFTADHLARLGANRGRITRVGNPIDAPSPIDDAERKELRASLGIDAAVGDHWLWAHVANLRPVKDQPTLLRGFAKALVGSPIPQSLCLLGDGKSRADLEALCGELGVRDRVHFLGFRNDVPKWLQAADGFAMSSRSEAMPMSLLEASLSGCLPVCTNVGGIGEVVRPGETGFLVERGDADALGRAMHAAVADIATSRSMATQVRHEVATEFSVPTILDAYYALYRSP